MEDTKAEYGTETATESGADAKPVFRVGEHFHGYVIEKQLGKGGLGTVWLARHEMLDTLFAIKTLNPIMAGQRPEYVKRFVREAKLSSKLRHPNLVTVHDAGFDADKGLYYLVMDYIAGGTLRDAIAFGGPMVERDAVQIVLQVASALAAAQRFGMVHRDIKPENIMQTRDGTVKLVDLGIAKIADGSDSLKTTAKSVFGTPAYISPEQALDSSKVDVRADIYSLGIVLFELLSGKRPYDGNAPSEVIQLLMSPDPIPDVRTVNPRVSAKVAAVIQMMCAKRAADRIASPAKLLEMFAKIGYRHDAAPAEFAAEMEPGAEVQPIVIPEPPDGKANDTLSFDTKDEDIRNFVTELKRKRRRKTLMRLMWAVAAAATLCALTCLICGCLTPEKAERDAEETARELATAYWQAQTGLTNDFVITRPADALTLKIALEAVRQGLTNAVFPRIEGVARLEPGSNGLVRLSLADALALGARNNRRYQTLKEDVYVKALALDSERYAFDTKFTGFLVGALAGEPEIVKNTAEAGGGASRTFENGTSIAGNLAVDIVRMLRDDWHSTGLTGDLTVSVPLLRGAGRDIVREPLTQAERNLAYALFAFARYRQTYALSVAKAYYNVLEFAQNRRNSDDNARRLEQNWDRAEMMFKAGRMDRIQVDQAKTDLLAARQTIITKQQGYEDALDSFKITLGLVPEAPVALKDEELEKLESEMADLAASQPHALAGFPDETTALNTALVRRADLAATRGDVADCERAVKVAADALRADVTVEGGGAIDEERRQHRPYGGTESTFARLKISMPWDRRRERNAYRRALIALDQSRRTFEEAEDNVKNEVRAGYRNLAAARALYENKVESLKTAQMRVDSNDLFMQSGRSSMRDILEAESAMLTARNALCSAVISWRLSDLSLRNAMGTLEVK